MRDYIILNGVNSNTITGLLISKLPPISKPKQRNTIEEIDGRDGDIVTTLGYGAYDKQIEIGLYGNFDINEVIAYFNGSGTVVFSNENDKYYNYQILEQIDYEKLIRFKTATVKMHVQPFKYPLEETPVEIVYQYVNNEAEEMDLDNTAEAPLEIDLKGNTYQYTTTGKNLCYFSNYTDYGATFNGSEIKVVNPNGTAYVGNNFNLQDDTSKSGKTYTIYVCVNGTKETGTTGKALSINVAKTNNPNAVVFLLPSNTGTFNNFVSVDTITLTQNEVFRNFYVVVNNPITANLNIKVMIVEGSYTAETIGEYEPYTNGASPNPDYPQPVQVVSGYNTIKVEGKNLFDKDSVVGGFVNADGTVGGDTNAYRTSNFIPVQPNTAYYKTLTDSPRTKFFDANKQVLDSSTYQDISIGGNAGTFTTPNNAYYFRFSYPIASVNANTIMLNKGQTALPYTPYISQTYEIDLRTSKNIFDITKILKNKDLKKDTGQLRDTTGWYASDWIAIKPNTAYTSSNISSNTKCWYDRNKVFISYANETTATSPANAKYLRVNGTLASIESNPNLMIEEGDSQTTYEAYSSTELCKIGDYQDYIYKDSGKWYLHKEITKVDLSTLTWTQQTWGYQATTDLSNIVKPANTNTIAKLLCNVYTACTPNNAYGLSGNIEHGMSMYGSNLMVRETTITSSSDFNDMISNASAYLLNINATNTEITDTTLLGQLNALEEAKSYDTSTHITQNANQKPFVLNATALQKGSDTGVVNNIGNIYSKPTIDIEGTGTIGVYLEGNQMFNVDLSNSNEIIIDTTNLEAYDPSTSALMNRQVTGDYSNFKLNVGNNNVKVTGNVTKATITNYVRWL